MMRHVTVIHEDATPKAITLRVDVSEPFSLDDLKKGFNRRINDKVDPLHPEDPHDWTPDQKRFVKTWNDSVGWAGFNRLPQAMTWAEDSAERNRVMAAIGVGDVSVLTGAEQDEALMRVLSGLSPEAAQRAVNLLQSQVKGSKADKKASMKAMGESHGQAQTAAEAKAASADPDDEAMSLAKKIGANASVRNRAGEAAQGGEITDVNSGGPVVAGEGDADDPTNDEKADKTSKGKSTKGSKSAKSAAKQSKGKTSRR